MIDEEKENLREARTIRKTFLIGQRVRSLLRSRLVLPAEGKMLRCSQGEGTPLRIDVKVVGRRRNLPGPGNKTGKRSRSHVRPPTRHFARKRAATRT